MKSRNSKLSPKVRDALAASKKLVKDLVKGRDGWPLDSSDVNTIIELAAKAIGAADFTGMHWEISGVSPPKRDSSEWITITGNSAPGTSADAKAIVKTFMAMPFYINAFSTIRVEKCVTARICDYGISLVIYKHSPKETHEFLSRHRIDLSMALKELVKKRDETLRNMQQETNNSVEYCRSLIESGPRSRK